MASNTAKTLAAVGVLAQSGKISPVAAAAYALGHQAALEACADDTAVPDAVDDFYMSINKGWLDDPANVIPGEYSSWGGFTRLHDLGLKKQITMVKALKDKAEKNEEEAKISAIWEASAARFAAWKAGTADCTAAESELKILDEFLEPERPIAGEEDLLDRVTKYLHYTQVNGFGNIMDFDKGSDLTNVNHVVLDLSTCGLSLPSRDYYTDDNFAPKREAYKKHLTNVSGLLKGGGVALDADFVENVYAFEQKLAAVTMKRDQSREYDQYYTNTNLEDLYTKINDLRSLEKKEENYEEADRNFTLDEGQLSMAKSFYEKMYTLFGFRDVMSANNAKNFPDGDGPNAHHITTYDGDAIRRVTCMLGDQANFAQYHSFLQYKVIRKVQGYCTKALDDEFFDFYTRTLSGQTEQKPDDKRSIGIVNAFAGEMMGKVFVAEMFPPECKVEVSAMIQDTLGIMKTSIEEADWLTDTTRAKALVKLDKFNVKIGYPDVWKDYSDFDVQAGDSLYQIAKKAMAWTLRTEFYEKLNSKLDRDEWHMTPQTVNAYFSPTQNEIVFPAAILQPPFYHKSDATIDFDIEHELASGDAFAAAANFGGIGAVIAHEITHGYDDKGRKFDGDGNLNDWWTDDDAALFKTKTEIMSKQAETYTFVDKEDGNKVYTQNPDLTMGENLADLGGLSLSLKALKSHLEASNATEAVATANLRVAFKSWAAIWKLNIKKDSRIQRLTTDPHAPCEFRGNLVAHMDEFYQVFGVKEGDGMYIPPAARLRMW